MRAALFILLAPFVAAAAQSPRPAAPLSRLPVKEVTIFKDGHAFIVHEGRLPTDPAGNVSIDQLPTPVLGTFWPFATDRAATLVATVAGRQQVRGERPAVSLADLVAANVGAEVTIAADSTGPIRGTLLSMGRPGAVDSIDAVGSEIVLVATSSGVRAVRVGRVGDILFKNPPRQVLSYTEQKNRLTLKLGWGGAVPSAAATVGMGYVQQGLQWVPSYRIALNGKGGATVSLQATIVNDVVDLEAVTARLVIGVPSFRFRGMIDPMALQDALASLTESDNVRRLSNFALGGLRTQVSDYASVGGADGATEPRDLEGARHEDLFVFTVSDLTLKKGERTTIPVAQYQVKYSDLFALTIYHMPPQEIPLSNQSPEQLELVRKMNRPTVMHKIRIQNGTANPFTTAPALILRGDQLLAQGMMTYTPNGGTVDLDVTQAVDIQVEKSENELRRTPGATRWQGTDYSRVDLNGELTLTNHRDTPVEVEVTRYLLGAVDLAPGGGKASRVNVLEDDEYLPPRFAQWWNWYSWPHWWTRLNGIGKVQWTVQLVPAVARKLSYRWHYYWEP